MKKLILLSMVVLVFFACKKDAPSVNSFRLDPNAKISLRPDMKGWANATKAPARDNKDNPKYLTPMEIVKQVEAMAFKNEALFGDQDVERGFSAEMRDTVSNPPCLKMWGTDIIGIKAEYVPDFIEATNCVLVRNFGDPNQDTVAYVPNAVLRSAEKQIKDALAAHDTLAVYRIFNEAFTFLPITGEEWSATEGRSD